MCPWRNWIAHLIPIQKAAGSSPVGRAIADSTDDYTFIQIDGVVAQLEEHNAGSVGVEGSSPFSSTITLLKHLYSSFRILFL
jgi:hypothetical protein